MAQSLVRLLSEGSGQGDAKADAQLRAQAVHSHLRLLNRPNLPDTLLKACQGLSAVCVLHTEGYAGGGLCRGR